MLPLTQAAMGVILLDALWSWMPQAIQLNAFGRVQAC